VIDRVVFISVLMILSLTATAGAGYYGRVAADTSVIPTQKTKITERPLAERVETKSSGDISKKKTVSTEKKVAGTAPKATPKEKTGTAVKAKADSGEKTAGKPKAVSAEKSTSWEEAMSAEKKNKTPDKEAVKTASTATTKATTTKTATTKATAAKATAAKTTAAKTTAAKTTATSTTATNTAATKTAATKTTTAKATSTKTTTAKKTTGSAVSGKKLAAATPADINRATITRSLKTSKTKHARTKLRKGIGIELYQPLAFKYAILLDVPVEKVTDEKLLEVLDHWYGTRYRFGGETRRGIDCSAFTQAFITSYFDYELPRRAEEQFNACKKIKKKKLRQGDLVFFKTHGPKGGITHVGVYLLNNRFVHSASSTGVRISDLNDDYYKARYAGGGRIR
jgi:cell wall-associated NlpC family hydrolase